MTDINTFFDDLDRQRAKQTSASIVMGGQVDPERAAKSKSVGDTLGVAPALVDQDPDLFDRWYAQREMSEHLAEAPKLQDWLLADRNRADMAKDDLKNISDHATIFGKASKFSYRMSQTVGPALVEGFPQMTSVVAEGVAALPQQAHRSAMQQRLDIFERIVDLPEGMERSEIGEALGLDGHDILLDLGIHFLAQDTEGRAQMIDQAVEGILLAETEIEGSKDYIKAIGQDAAKLKTDLGVKEMTKISTADDAAKWIGYQLGQGVPILAMFSLIAAATGGTGLMGASAAFGAGEINAALLEEDIDRPDLAVIGSIPYALAERLAVPAKFIKGSMERFSKSFVMDALREGGTEVLQESITAFAKAIETGELEIDWAAMLEVFSVGAMLGGGFGKFASATGEIFGEAQQRKFERDVTNEILDRTDALSEASKLKERDVETYKSALDAQDLDKANIYVSAEEVKSYYQSAGVEIDYEALGVTEADFDAMVETGGDIAIPMSNYAAYISGGDHHKFFRKMARLDPNAFSEVEAELWQATVGDVMQSAQIEAEQALTEGRAIQEQDQQIYDSLTAQLMGAGRTSEVADREARVFTAFFRTMADRYGMDVTDMAARFGLKIEKGETTPQDVAAAEREIDDLRELSQAQPDPRFAPQIVDDDPVMTEEQIAASEEGRVLPEPSFYLYETEDSVRVPLSSVKPIRARPDGIARARPLMAQAALGGNRRQPLSVTENGDGTYTLLDGNSTYAVLQEAGAEEAIVRPMTREQFMREDATTELKKILEGKTKPRYVRVTEVPEATFQYAWLELRRRQPFESLEDMVGTEDQLADQDYLNDLLASIAKDLGLKVKAAPPKGMKRAAEKVDGKYRGDYLQLADTVRGGFIAQTPQEAAAFIGKLSEVLVVLDEGFIMTPVGYFDEKVSVLLPSGRWAEVQVWPTGMLEAKEGSGHALYEVSRDMTGRWTDAEKAQAEEDQKDLYLNVVANLDQSWSEPVAAGLAAQSSLAARVAATPALNSSSVISGASMSRMISRGSTGQLSLPTNAVAEDPSSSIRTYPTSRVLKNRGIDSSPSDGENVTGARPLYQSAARFQSHPLEFESEGRLTKQQVARRWTELHDEAYGRKLDPQNNPDDFEHVVSEILKEYAEQQGQGDIGLEWYTADIADAISVTMEIIPELSSPVKRDVFMMLAALTSPRERPVPNWEKAVDAMQQYLRDGTLPEVKENGKAFGVPTVTSNVRLMQHVISTLGEEGAMVWLLEPHTGAELAEMRRASGLYTDKATLSGYTPSEVSMKDEVLGVYMFGPKVGDFFLNASGFSQDAVTVDMWLAQTYNRHIGRLLDIGPKALSEGKVASEVRGKAERVTIKRIIAEAANRAGVKNSAFQAAMWYFEQRLERSQGLRSDSQNFKQGAIQAAEKRGVSHGYEAGQRAGRDVPRTRAEEARELYQGAAIRRSEIDTGGRPVSEGRVPQTDAPTASEGGGSGHGYATPSDLEAIARGDLSEDFFLKDGWAVISATQDWGSDPFGPKMNAEAAERMRRNLTRQGIPFIEQQGVYEGEDDGVTFLVLADPKTVTLMAKQNSQESILTNQGLIYTKRVQPNTPFTGRLMTGDEAMAQDYYSVIDGVPYSLGLDFSTGAGVAVMPDGYTEAEGRPQLPVNANGKVELHHWGPEGLLTVDPSFAGTNPRMRGAERHDAIKKSFFGINPRRSQRDAGTGYVKEYSTGDTHYVAEIDPEQIYPIYSDPDGLTKGKTREEAEAAIKDAGYIGYYTEDDGTMRSPLGNVAALFEGVDVAPATREYFQIAYHGTPHQHDGFSLDHIGSGEGVQAFGWGLYFAEERKVADMYRRKLSKGSSRDLKSAIIDGVKYSIKTDKSLGRLMRETGLSRNAATIVVNQADTPDYARRHLAFVEARPRSFRSDYVAAMREVVSFFDTHDVRGANSKKGRTFKVDLPEGQHLAQWEKPLSEQHPDVKAGVERVLKSLGRVGTVEQVLEEFEGRLGDIIDDVEAASRLHEDTNVRAEAKYDLDRARELQEAIEFDQRDPDWYTEDVSELLGYLENKSRVAARLLTDLHSARDFEALLGFLGDDPMFSAVYEGVQSHLAGKVGERGAPKATSEAFKAQGILGHKYLDGFSRGKGDGTYNFVIWDDEAINVLEYDQSQEGAPQGGPRGKIEIPAGGIREGAPAVIKIFESADATTALHEGGHFFFEVFAELASDPNAPQQMKDDLEVIKKHTGWDGKGPIPVSAHEIFAKSFEAYVLEGVSPSLELGDIFSRTKHMILRLFEYVKGLGVKMTPEVAEVFDRMLASDAQIAEARELQAMTPLFTEAPAGMTDAQFATYQRMARRSEEEAQKRLYAKAVEKITRETKAWWKAARKDVRAEVADDINARPEYRLIEMLANRRWIGADDDVPDTDLRIHIGILKEMFGEDITGEIDRSKLGGKRNIFTEDGEDPRVVAEFFGFETVGDMMDALKGAGKRSAKIEAETDRIMLERYGDPLADGSIEEQAMDAVHNDQQANAAIAEARHLAKQMGRETRGMTIKLYRARARAMIAEMPVSVAAKPAQFLAAERRAAKKAQEAFAAVARGKVSPSRPTKGGGMSRETGGAASLAEAFQAKEQQILNQMLYDESRKVEAEVRKIRDRMRKYDKASVRKKLAGGYIEQIDALLERFDFRVRSKRQIERSESLVAFVQRMEEEGRGDAVNIDPRLIDDAARKHYTKMTVDELMGLSDTIKNLDHLGRLKQSLIDAKNKRDLKAVVQDVSRAIRDNLGTKGGRQNPIRLFFNLLFTADTILIEADGMDEYGAAYAGIKEAVDQGYSEEQRLSVALSEKLSDLFGKFSKAEMREMTKERMVEGANGGLWSKMQIITLALNSGNADNLQRVLDPDVHQDVRLTRDQLEALLNTLDAREIQLVNDVWALVDSYWGEISAISERQTGVKPKKVGAVPMVVDGGLLNGGYYPIKYDPEKSAKAAKDSVSNRQQELAGGGGRTGMAKVRDGFTKERRKTGGGRAVSYDISHLFSHLRDVIHNIALSEAIYNSGRVLNSMEVTQAWLDAGRKDDLDTLNMWLDDAARGPIFNTDVVNRAARMLKNNFTLSRLAFNLKTVALQITGIGQSMATVGKKNMLLGYRDYLRDFGLANEVARMSPFMAERMSTFQKDVYDMANDTKVWTPLKGIYGEAKEMLAKVGFAPIVYVQYYGVDVPTFLAGYRAGMERFGDEAKAIAYAERMVARSQDSGLISDRSAIARGSLSSNVRQADFVRIFTTLQGYMLTKMNRANVTIRRGVKGVSDADTNVERFAQAANMAADLMLLYLFEAVVMGIGYAMMAGDEADEEDYAAFLLQETGSAIFGGIPFGRDAYSVMVGYGGGGVYGTITEAPHKMLQQWKQGENDRALRSATAGVIGLSTGLPTTASMRVIEGILEPDEVSPAEMLFGSNPMTR